MKPLRNNNVNKYENTLLSATQSKKTLLNVSQDKSVSLNTKLRQKSKIKIYIIDDKYYVEHATAYALKLINTRAIMMDKPKLIEISADIHNRLKANSDIEIEYEKIVKKQKIKVYFENANYSITMAAAYALNFISVEEFNSQSNEYYYINKETLQKLKEKFDVEFVCMNLKTEMEKLSKQSK